MEKRRRATIKDVATQAGFSVATVSRILNGENTFLPDTRKKIWTIAHSLGYEPSISARKLRAGTEDPKRTRTNLIMRILALGSDTPIGDQDSASSAQMFDWIASQNGFFTTNYRYFQLEGFRCPLLLDRLIDGVIVGTPHNEVIESVSKKVPTVLLNVGDSHLFPELHRVNPAVEDGMRSLLIEAYTLGHRHAAIVGAAEREYSQESFATRHLRKYANIADELGIKIEDRHRFQPAELTCINHDQIMEQITDTLIPEIKTGKISLLVCEDYVYSDTILSLLEKKGIRVPDDISIIGISTCSCGSMVDPRVTSAYLNWEQMFQTSIKVLDDLINGTPLPCREFRIPTTIHKGETLGAVQVRK